MKTLPVLFRDDFLIAVHKPPGLHVHPTALSPGEDSCMRILRDQLGQWVYTIHRLDRATSGVLLFALDSATANAMIEQFAGRTVQKRYLAVTRGYLPEGDQSIERPLREEKHLPPADAITEYRRLATAEIAVATGNFPTARYSLAAVEPHTGRKNQIRRHLAGISHPVIGDVRFGDGRHNRIFRDHFDCHRLLLMATDVRFAHPVSGKPLHINAPLPADVLAVFAQLGWGSGELEGKR